MSEKLAAFWQHSDPSHISLGQAWPSTTGNPRFPYKKEPGEGGSFVRFFDSTGARSPASRHKPTSAPGLEDGVTLAKVVPPDVPRCGVVGKDALARPTGDGALTHIVAGGEVFAGDESCLFVNCFCGLHGFPRSTRSKRQESAREASPPCRDSLCLRIRTPTVPSPSGRRRRRACPRSGW